MKPKLLLSRKLAPYLILCTAEFYDKFSVLGSHCCLTFKNNEQNWDLVETNHPSEENSPQAPKFSTAISSNQHCKKGHRTIYLLCVQYPHALRRYCIKNTTVCSLLRNTVHRRASEDWSCYNLQLIICLNFSLSMFVVIVLNTQLTCWGLSHCWPLI